MRLLILFSLLFFSLQTNAQKVTIECHACEVEKKISCKGCDINTKFFSGIVLKEKNMEDIGLYHPVKVKTRGSLVTFKDAFGNQKQVSLSRLISKTDAGMIDFPRMKNLYDFLTDCTCGSDEGIVVDWEDIANIPDEIYNVDDADSVVGNEGVTITPAAGGLAVVRDVFTGVSQAFCTTCFDDSDILISIADLTTQINNIVIPELTYEDEITSNFFTLGFLSHGNDSEVQIKAPISMMSPVQISGANFGRQVYTNEVGSQVPISLQQFTRRPDGAIQITNGGVNTGLIPAFIPPVVATNGTLTGPNNRVELGGKLYRNTDIDTEDFDLTITDPYATFRVGTNFLNTDALWTEKQINATEYTLFGMADFSPFGQDPDGIILGRFPLTGTPSTNIFINPTSSRIIMGASSNGQINSQAILWSHDNPSTANQLFLLQSKSPPTAIEETFVGFESQTDNGIHKAKMFYTLPDGSSNRAVIEVYQDIIQLRTNHDTPDADIATFTDTGMTINRDIEVDGLPGLNGVILKSPNGNRYRITINNGGNLISTLLP